MLAVNLAQASAVLTAGSDSVTLVFNGTHWLALGILAGMQAQHRWRELCLGTERAGDPGHQGLPHPPHHARPEARQVCQASAAPTSPSRCRCVGLLLLASYC